MEKSRVNAITKYIKNSLRNVWINKLRSILTVLGIVVGISSVTIMVSVGESAQAYISNSLTSSLNSNVFFVLPGSEEESSSFSSASFLGRFTEKDLLAFKGQGIDGVTAYSRRTNKSFTIESRGQEYNFVGMVVDPGFFDALSKKPLQGRLFNENDANYKKRNVVIDKSAAEIVFKLQDPIGKELSIDGQTFVIVGVVELAQTGGFGMEPTPIVIMLAETYKSVYNKSLDTSMIMYSIDDMDRQDEIKRAVSRKLASVRGLKTGEEYDFNIQGQGDLLDTTASITGIVTTFITVIASISLIVGGIGVMNIMLVSVKERIKEIGLRKAVGARDRDILLQFLIESVTFTVIGGVIGLVFGGIIAVIIQRIAGLPVLISATAVMSAFLVSLIVGGVFGLFPANQAAKLSPIEALRSE